ncbi:MAG: PorT family protein [Balneolales bacterium]|nr:PorT family protein [Balneolales bacterium]
MLLRITYLLIFITTMSFTAVAQQYGPNTEGVSYGLKVGFDMQNFVGDDVDDAKLKPAYHVGLFTEVPVAPDFYAQPGLFLNSKGARFEEGPADGFFRINYVEIPINFLYKPIVGNGIVTFGGGPYVAYGVAGQYEISGGSLTMESDIEFTNNVRAEDGAGIYFRPFDAGVGIVFGYEFNNRIGLQLNTQIGLTNILPDVEGESPDTSVKNIGFGLSLGYRF